MPQAPGPGPLRRASQPAPSNPHGTFLREGCSWPIRLGWRLRPRDVKSLGQDAQLLGGGHGIRTGQCGRTVHAPDPHAVPPTLLLLGPARVLLRGLNFLSSRTCYCICDLPPGWNAGCFQKVAERSPGSSRRERYVPGRIPLWSTNTYLGTVTTRPQECASWGTSISGRRAVSGSPAHF